MQTNVRFIQIDLKKTKQTLTGENNSLQQKILSICLFVFKPGLHSSCSYKIHNASL